MHANYPTIIRSTLRELINALDALMSLKHRLGYMQYVHNLLTSPVFFSSIILSINATQVNTFELSE